MFLEDEQTDLLLSAEDPFKLGQLTETQTALAEKFNSAFYEAQEQPQQLFATCALEDSYFDAISDQREDDNFLLDFLISKEPIGGSTRSTYSSEESAGFDYNEFADNFERVLVNPEQQSVVEEALLLPLEDLEDEDSLEGFDFSDTDLCADNLSTSSIDLDSIIMLDEYEQYGHHQQRSSGRLPPVNTIGRGNVDFMSFIRNAPADSLVHHQNQQQEDLKSNYGHLIGHKSVNNNVSSCDYDLNLGETGPDSAPQNQLILSQNEAIIYEDLSSYQPVKRGPRTLSESDNDNEEPLQTTSALQCLWKDCYNIYESLASLVRHIEKTHVEVKRGEEFTCFWENCTRRNKPFNARYKLLIHMRVHSGEKPNKCPFRGCSKAFSRLENLKIHQRSHTGERPYLCQFATCTKSFSNSSDRAKHQRTHYDTKPYACQVVGCTKKYTDPSSLRKHVKNHSFEEQAQLKSKSAERSQFQDELGCPTLRTPKTQFLTKFVADFHPNLEHSYSNSVSNLRQEIKNKLSEKISKEKRTIKCG